MTVARILANKGRGVVTTAPDRTLQEVSVELNATRNRRAGGGQRQR